MSDGVEGVDNRDEIDRVKTLIRQLSPRERRILKARYWRDEPLKEIAASEKISTDSVKHSLQKSLEKLRENMG